MKIFNTLDEILEFTGCDVVIPTNHPLDKYAVFEVVDPYNCKYIDWATERGILQLDIFVKGKTLIAYLPKYSEIGEKENMEKYIASYKHLIGCEVYCSEKDRFFTFNENMNILSYDRFYLDDENLGTYEDYMQLHYPEYVHVWSQQL